MGRKSVCAPHHETILELTSRGVGRHTIADRIGVSHASLSAYMIRRNLKSGRPRGGAIKISRLAIQHLVEDQGLTLEETAQRLGTYRSTIERAAHKMGLKIARTGPRSGSGHPEWKGGRLVGKHGYVEVWAPMHPASRKSTGRVLEHRLVMEMVLGRYLLSGEVVDHRDNHPRHNWPDNLRLYASNADHLRETLTGREKSTLRSSVPGAYGCSQKIDHCPELHETLAQCPPEVRVAVEWHIWIHRPKKEHAHLPQSKLLRSGAHRVPFQDTSMG